LHQGSNEFLFFGKRLKFLTFKHITVTIFDIDEIEKEWKLFKDAREREMDSALPKYLFEATQSLLKDHNFETMIDETKYQPRSVLMARKCEQHNGHLAVVLSDNLKENQVAIVQDKNAGKEFYKYRDFEPIDIDTKLLATDLSIVTGILFGPSIGTKLYESLTPRIPDSALQNQYMLIGMGLGCTFMVSFSLIFGHILERYENRKYKQFQSQLLFEPYRGIDAIDVILGSKSGDYESKFAGR
jgi:hypothetical protein